MAKQSGIHQLRGKVGEHSYYRQTGITPGLVRQINQGLSSRVKTGEEFANTRLNNAEFGQAGRIAKVFGMFITPKYRPMILPFSQSKMAKIILTAIKSADAPWGQRNLNTNNLADIFAQALNSVSKNRFEDFGLSLTIDEETTTLSVSSSELTQPYLDSIGASDMLIRFVACSPWIGTFVESDNRYADSFARGINYDAEIDGIGTTSIQYSLRPAPPSGWPAFTGRMGVVIVMPRRSVNNENYILQEHCSFHAFPIDDGTVI